MTATVPETVTADWSEARATGNEFAIVFWPRLIAEPPTWVRLSIQGEVLWVASGAGCTEQGNNLFKDVRVGRVEPLKLLLNRIARGWTDGLRHGDRFICAQRSALTSRFAFLHVSGPIKICPRCVVVRIR